MFNKVTRLCRNLKETSVLLDPTDKRSKLLSQNRRLFIVNSLILEHLGKCVFSKFLLKRNLRNFEARDTMAQTKNKL